MYADKTIPSWVRTYWRYPRSSPGTYPAFCVTMMLAVAGVFYAQLWEPAWERPAKMVFLSALLLWSVRAAYAFLWLRPKAYAWLNRNWVYLTRQVKIPRPPLAGELLTVRRDKMRKGLDAVAQNMFREAENKELAHQIAALVVSQDFPEGEHGIFLR